MAYLKKIFKHFLSIHNIEVKEIMNNKLSKSEYNKKYYLEHPEYKEKKRLRGLIRYQTDENYKKYMINKATRYNNNKKAVKPAEALGETLAETPETLETLERLCEEPKRKIKTI